MSRKIKRTFPSGAARTGSALLASLLALCLFVFSFSLIGMQVLQSRDLHLRVALEKGTVDLQMERLRQNLTGIAEKNGFDPALAVDSISRESVEEYDRQIVTWWTGFAATGEMAEKPVYHTAALEEALGAAQEWTQTLDPMMVNNTIDAIRIQVETEVDKSAVLFRDLLVRMGVRFASRSINLPQMVEILGKVPLIAGLAGLLIAGLILLLMSRRMLSALWPLGGAVSACGLLDLFALILIRSANIHGLIAEASAMLANQYAHLARILTGEILAAAAGALVLGGVLMFLGRKGTE